jgi:hypothetical protein
MASGDGHASRGHAVDRGRQGCSNSCQRMRCEQQGLQRRSCRSNPRHVHIQLRGELLQALHTHGGRKLPQALIITAIIRTWHMYSQIEAALLA